MLLGKLSTHTQHFQLRDSHPLRSTIPSQFAYHHALRRCPVRTPTTTPTTPMMQHLTAITHHRFSLIRVRSPLLTESLLFSLPAGTEMFHFPAFPPTGLYIQPAVTHQNDERGFPIRKSSDPRPVIGSPRLIADSHVLHRLLMPRHPPCALNNLHTIKKKKNQETTQPCSSQKMLASTI